MNPSNNGQRYRGPSNGAHVGPGPRLGEDIRNGNAAAGFGPPSASNGRLQVGAQMSRAEKFEDEKKRIIDSLFSKKDQDGSSPESYITHIRIEEDSDFPSTPPPLSSTPHNKKSRVIIVAVKKSGRVRMHKGRENSNGTFSIGKTWPLDDLNRVESYTHAIPQTPEQHQDKQRAGATGFLITIGKPYYWQAATAKEKEFFIFSLIKIYRKYTGGKVPELVGFSPQELDQFGGSATVQTSTQVRNLSNGVPGAVARGPSQDRTSPRAPPADVLPTPLRMPSQDPNMPRAPPADALPTSLRMPSQDPNMPRAPRPDIPATRSRVPSQDPLQSRAPRLDGTPPATSRERGIHPSHERGTQERPFPSVIQQEHRVLHSAASRERSLRPAPSHDRIHLPGSFPSTDSIPSLSSQPQLRPKRSASPGSYTTSAQTGSSRAPSENRNAAQGQYDPDHTSLPPSTTGRSSSEQSRQNGTYSSASRFRNPSQQRPEPADERPRTAGRDDSIPSALVIRDPRQTKPSSFKETRAQSDHSNHAQTSQALPTETRDGDTRKEFTEARHLDEDQNSGPEPQHMEPHSTDDVRSTMHSSKETPSERPKQYENAAPPTPLATEDSSIPGPSPAYSPTPPPETPPEPEVHRPGLGPMIKKKSNKEIASQLRKAATAYGAFKPRAGGAADKAQDESPSTGDGITGVFQAPSLLRGARPEEVRPATPTAEAEVRPCTPEAKKELPSVSVSSPPAKPVAEATDHTAKRQDTNNQEPQKPAAAVKPPLPIQDERRKNRQSGNSAKYAKSLGIAPSLLEGRTFEIEAVLNDFGWGEDSNKTTFEDLEIGIRKELGRVEAGSWLGAVENNDDRTTAVSDMMDKVMAECEELDCLLTLYNVELGTLSEDVAYIEAQSQGLQVQTANQKLLHTELKNLLHTISISTTQLSVLKDSSLTKTRGILEVESILGQLYTAMLTIDPKLRHTSSRPMSPDQASLHRSSSTGYGGTELSSMQAVREKREGYRKESVDFIQRLKQYMSIKFRASEAETSEDLNRNREKKASEPAKLDDRLRVGPKWGLWKYSPLILFAREIEPSEWGDMIGMYEGCAKRPYQEEFKDNIFAWKRMTRKPAGDEADVLFTTQEKESESIVGRKLTVKRAKTVRADGSSRISGGDKPKDGKITAYEAFAGALTEEARIVFIEQNFLVDFFHISSLESKDFVDAIATNPEARKAGDLLAKKPFDPDRSMARKVFRAMEGIFSFWSSDIQSLVDWAVKQDALNGVGILFSLESQLAEVEETNQEFLSQVVSKIHDRLVTQFTRFIEEQIRGIEDTKVKIKKRKGVIAFMKTFPSFSIAVENMLPPVRSLDHLPIRGLINQAYQRINKAMFESLKFIAKESPSVHTATGVGDPEDKEALNHHILLIENMNHYIEEVSLRNNPVLEEWNFRARTEMKEHLDFYISAIIRRPLGKLLDFIESTESVLVNNPGNPAAVATRPSHSRSVFKKVLSSYDAKEIRRGIETLKKRVEKHFGDGDDTAGLTRDLVSKVLKACEERYLNVGERLGRLIREVYEGTLEAEWRRDDVLTAFRR
ncbi:MAG: hypothetical protein Q9163_001811 [Psora crenata]